MRIFISSGGLVQFVWINSSVKSRIASPMISLSCLSSGSSRLDNLVPVWKPPKLVVRGALFFCAFSSLRSSLSSPEFISSTPEYCRIISGVANCNARSRSARTGFSMPVFGFSVPVSSDMITALSSFLVAIYYIIPAIYNVTFSLFYA
jgi:hypothetical protein